ncbi:LysR substrate-binding domain-containing protein [Collimonas sp. OK242]|uniref:LysR substrate-binding domain-containing protein n=1 Tax=Collimonas sp. OK242 TaxID=1798195 RepID=UPI002100B16D|nr:LysR substrate-binding domain-containing protein [Collimonas sp. OK242]
MQSTRSSDSRHPGSPSAQYGTDEATMRGIELRQLRYFSILAKELHFRKAADLAFVTQPALSQQINKLEKTIGVALFTRDRRKVELTPAGMMLRDEVEKMFDQLQTAIRKTRETGNEREYRLSIGLIEYTNLPFVPPALMRLQEVYPALKVQRHEMNASMQIEALFKRVIDIGIGVPWAPLPSDISLRTEPVLTAPWMLLMRENHRLASLKEVRIDDLAGERLIMFERSVNSMLYDDVMARCRKAGFTPNYVYETLQSQVGISMVNQGLGLMLGAAYVFSIVPPGLTCRPIIDLDPLNVHIFTRADDADPLLMEFMELITEEARRMQIAQDASY